MDPFFDKGLFNISLVLVLFCWISFFNDSILSHVVVVGDKGVVGEDSFFSNKLFSEHTLSTVAIYISFFFILYHCYYCYFSV